jgi:hypothetical protein
LNQAILDTDILSEIIKGVDQTVAANAKTYRRAFGHYIVSAVTVMEVIRGYQRKQATRQLQPTFRTSPADYLRITGGPPIQPSYAFDMPSSRSTSRCNGVSSVMKLTAA